MYQAPRRSRWLTRAGVLLASLLATVGTATAVQATGTTTGVLEICKTAADNGVTGTFQFTVSGVTGNVTVPVGGCSNSITVTAGQVVVTEVARPGFAVVDITATTGRLVSKDIAARKATVNVVAGTVANETLVTFKNKTVPPENGTVKVCKVAGDGVKVGQVFSFTVGSTATTAQAGYCSAPVTVPVGEVTVKEQVPAGYQVSAISVAGAGTLVSSDLATATAVVKIAVGTTEVKVTNKATPPPTGTVKVCKVAGDGVKVGQVFSFTVGSTATTAQAGYCSAPVTVPVGEVTVKEQVPAGYQVSAISVAGAGSLVSSDLATATAVVKVVAGTTEVKVTNKIITGKVIVCKIAGEGVAAGEVFTFTVGQTTTTAKAGYCSDPITLPVGNVTVKETVPAGYHVTAITAAGAGSLASSDLAAGTAVVKVVAGDTKVSFTNKKPPVVSGCTYTKGYYKNHPDVVSSLLKGGTLAIGGVNLTAAQIDEIYGRNASNFLNQVSQQLITARLNQLGGASAPADVQTAINAAQALVTNAGGPLTGTGTSKTSVTYQGKTYTASALVDVLSKYNEGTAAGGPPHCG